MLEEGERQPLESETDAGGMGDIAALRVDAPRQAEMILVIVE
jgi:hypothetical protein